jgi:microfibrillar-associated protein 1
LDDVTEDGSSEEDYTEESEDSEERFSPLAQPLFVPKAHRQTIAEREALEREELQRVEQEKIRSSRRAQETKEIAAQKVAEDQAQEELAALGPKGAEDINTDDDSNPEEDYQAWKSREIERLRRDLEEKLKHEKEEQEKEIWRKMSEKDRDRYLEMKSKEARASSMAKIEDKAKWNFLQKYYHKGAFFQTEAEYKGEEAPLVGDLKNRDISSATGDDVFDKASLPRVMQVKNFGKRGQTKWTHLAAEDTTNLQSKTPK